MRITVDDGTKIHTKKASQGLGPITIYPSDKKYGKIYVSRQGSTKCDNDAISEAELGYFLRRTNRELIMSDMDEGQVKKNMVNLLSTAWRRLPIAIFP